MTKHYPSELRECAVRLVLDAETEPGGSRGARTRVGAQLGLDAETLHGWVIQFEVNQSGRAGVKTADAQRIRELERENNYGVYGVRKVHAQLLREGQQVARCTLERSERSPITGRRRQRCG